MFLQKDIKNMARKVFYYSGLADSLLGYGRHKLFILCYHRITGPNSKFKYLGVSQNAFEKHVEFLKKHFDIVSFNEGIGRFREYSIKKPLVILTFDDGYKDNYLYAYPVLKKYDITGTIFIATDFVDGKKRFWWDYVADIVINSPYLKTRLSERIKVVESINNLLKLMDHSKIEGEMAKLKEKFGCGTNDIDIKEREILNWEEIKEMSAYGIDFGSHTLTHANLTLLCRDELAKEVSLSKETLERVLGKKVNAFAYPHGFYNDDVKKVVTESGYLYARSMTNGCNSNGGDVFALKCISGCADTLNDLVARLSYRSL